MKEIMVIGLYEDTGQTFTYSQAGGDRTQAFMNVAHEAGVLAKDLIILGSITSNSHGYMTFQPAVDVLNGSAYASEFLGGGSDEDKK